MSVFAATSDQPTCGRCSMRVFASSAPNISSNRLSSWYLDCSVIATAVPLSKCDCLGEGNPQPCVECAEGGRTIEAHTIDHRRTDRVWSIRRLSTTGSAGRVGRDRDRERAAQGTWVGAGAVHAIYAQRMSVNVQIRNVDDHTVAVLKARAASQRMSLSDYLAAELDRLVARPTLDEVIDRLERRPRRRLDVTGAQLVLETRAEGGHEA